MLNRNNSENRSLVLNAKQLYLFQQKEFQLRDQFIESHGELAHLRNNSAAEEADENASFVLGYN